MLCFSATANTEICRLSLPGALPVFDSQLGGGQPQFRVRGVGLTDYRLEEPRLNSSHDVEPRMPSSA